MPPERKKRTKPKAHQPTGRDGMYNLLGSEDIAPIFIKFRSLLTGKDRDVLDSLEIMFPKSFSRELESLLISHCGKPSEDLDVIESATLNLDPDDPEELELAEVCGQMDKRHASDLQFIIGQIFKKNTLSLKLDTFYSENKKWFDRLVTIENQFSLNISTNDLLKISGDEVEVVMNKSARAPLPEFVSVFPFAPQIMVDIATADFLAEKTKEIITGNFNAVMGGLNAIVSGTGYIAIKIGTISMNVSAHILLWLIKFLYDKGISKTGTIGRYFNHFIELIIEHQKTLLGSPFMNFSNPDPEESKMRRANRIVYIYLYTMIYLLYTIKEIIMKPSHSRLPNMNLESKIREKIGDEIIDFIKKAKIWKLDEILNYGPKLFNLIHGGRDSLGMKSYLNKYYENYDHSIGIVIHLLDLRIFDAKIKINTLITLLTPLSILESAPEYRQATPDQVTEIQGAIADLERLNMIEEPQRRLLQRLGYLVPGGAGARKAKKKRTRRRSKSMDQRSAKGKQKRKGKLKQTKRRRKKK